MRVINRPTVALTLRITQASGYREPRDAISHDWLARLQSWNMTPVLIPNILESPEEYLDAVAPDLLILSGGDDPGATPERDATEARLLIHALNRKRSVFGVCRGMQLINLHFGGRIAPVTGHVATTHAVTIDERWRDFYASRPIVNSYHGQGISGRDLASGLVATATDEALWIEGFVHEALPMAAVMWHPERDGGPFESDRKLIERLIATGASWL